MVFVAWSCYFVIYLSTYNIDVCVNEYRSAEKVVQLSSERKPALCNELKEEQVNDLYHQFESI